MPYKMFNKDLTCNGFQYKEGETYQLSEDEELHICHSGFHYCENPSSCLNYYYFLDKELNVYPMCEVTPLGAIETKGDKFVTDKIKINDKLSLKQVVQANFEFNKKQVKGITNKKISSSNKSDRILAERNDKIISSNGEYTQIISVGANNRITANGDGALILSNKDNNRIAINGYYAKVISTGVYDRILINGSDSTVITEGMGSNIVTTESSNRIVANGEFSNVTALGYNSRAVANGKNSIIVHIGRDGMAKGVKGTWITLAEYRRDEKLHNYIPIYVKSFKVDGKKIKENTFYKLENKKLVEVKE